jgi:hypothetical protein
MASWAGMFNGAIAQGLQWRYRTRPTISVFYLYGPVLSKSTTEGKDGRMASWNGIPPERRLHALALLAYSASLGKGRSEMGMGRGLIGDRPVWISTEDQEAYMNADSDEERETITKTILEKDIKRRQIENRP